MCVLDQIRIIFFVTLWTSLTHVGGTTAYSQCFQISRFTPNMCQYSAMLHLCSHMCSSKVKDHLDCGERKPLYRRIIGGVKSTQGEWPWHVSLSFKGKQYCAGSILSEYFVLTAAHCFDEDYTSNKIEHWKVSAGDHQLSISEAFEQKIDVKKIIMHPKYRVSKHGPDQGLWVIHNDIAIVELQESIKLHHSNKASLCLPDDYKSIPDFYGCYIVGWGHTAFAGEQSDELRHAKVYTVPNSICNSEIAYNNTVNSKELICAGYKDGGIDACNYDSGGALVCNKEGRWYATGIVSSGFECARPHSYGLYTNVAEYKDWVIKNILFTTN
ncbi:serine protease hepsin-like [Hydractinia symbiolongicarpus]|uniref:serine protease hepsin-like n=1 Tax=Hydractinia symbiolongicarpus TaxID=13093 RepID=UPI00254D8E5E|nr:serine protease hepsin-like [Hydractinia symbiolongicarpus]